MYQNKIKKPTTLFKWVWWYYLKITIIPLVLIELIFLGIYFTGNNWSQKEMIRFIAQTTRQELIQNVRQEAKLIEEQLAGVAYMAEVYQMQISKALTLPAAMQTEDLERLKYSPEGVYYSYRDKESGGAAIFYSGIYKVGDKEQSKIAKILKQEELMKTIIAAQPLAEAIYINTFDSLNVIYPYFDVTSQYLPLIDITKFNFYYEADNMHNPERKVKWTDSYLDPAGRGWMASVIAPVYQGDFLEGVIGIDITIHTIVNQVLNIKTPWGGYGMLIGKDGTILALPSQGEEDWGLTELKQHTYAEAILKDTFKPSEFNLYNKIQLNDFTDEVSKSEEGFSKILLGGVVQKVSWATIPGTGWKLLVVVPQENVFATMNSIKNELFKIAAFMFIGLILFYGIFFFVISFNVHKMSSKISELLLKINAIVQKIGQGAYYQTVPDIEVQELQDTATCLVHMGEQLGSTNKSLIKMQDKLKNREAHLQALINSIDDIIIELDEHGYFLNVWANDEGNLANNFLQGDARSIDAIMENCYAECVRKKMKKVIETRGAQTVEYQLLTSKGVRWFEARLTLISSETRTIVATVRDITEYKEQEDALND